MRSLSGAAFIAFALLVPNVSLADTRIALVIGVGSYTKQARLPNPPRDAAAIAQALRVAGFDSVDLVTDSERPADTVKTALDSRLAAFATKAATADVAVVYFAGHGIEVDGQNYLLPGDTGLTQDSDLYLQTVKLDTVLKAVRPRQLGIFVIDACRDNPFLTRMTRGGAVTRSVGAGLARPEPSPDSVVFYAAAAGAKSLDGVGSHSPFAAALLRRLPEPLELDQLLRSVSHDVRVATDDAQIPTIYSARGRDDFYFSRTPSVAAAGAVPPSPVRPKSSPAEDALRLGLEAYDQGNRVKAAGLYRQAADLGYAPAQHKLANLYYFGEGVPQSYATSVAWHRRAAEQGWAKAQSNLAYHYQHGLGVEKDVFEAIVWYRKAADQGDASAQNNLGTIFGEGDGLKPDYPRAMFWFRKAAAQGDAGALHNIGWLYHQGMGVAVNLSEARKWYAEAAARGHVGAQEKLLQLR